VVRGGGEERHQVREAPCPPSMQHITGTLTGAQGRGADLLILVRRGDALPLHQDSSPLAPGLGGPLNNDILPTPRCRELPLVSFPSLPTLPAAGATALSSPATRGALYEGMKDGGSDPRLGPEARARTGA
jgi:hypothetical protein